MESAKKKLGFKLSRLYLLIISHSVLIRLFILPAQLCRVSIRFGVSTLTEKLSLSSGALGVPRDSLLTSQGTFTSQRRFEDVEAWYGSALMVPMRKLWLQG